MAVQIKITFTGGGNLGEIFDLDLSEPRLLGRTHTADVVISKEDADVSKRHLEFRADDGGAAVACLSRNGLLLNDKTVGEGECRPIRRGDEIRLGKRVRIRVDHVGASGAADRSPAGSETFATQALSGTFATQAIGEESLATRMTGMATVATRMTGEARTFSGSVVETPIGDASSVAPTRFTLPAAAAAAGVTAPDAVTDADAPTGGANGPVTFSGADARSISGTTGGGETVAMETRVGNMDVIRAIAEEKQRAKRFKQRLMTVAAFGAFAVLGVLVYCFWPHSERWLRHPQPLVRHHVKSPTGATRLFVDYPKDSRTRTGERANGGIDVETLTGKERDVPFRLSFDVRRRPEELALSLEESSEREIASLVKRGYAFDPVGADEGFSFFEREFPMSCENGGTQRGVRFCRREFTRSDGSGQWHGVLIYFRDVDTAYRLLREIPETEWPRGKWLLREDPNLALCDGFLRDHWESPGTKALEGYAGRSATDLLKEIDAAFERNIPNEWKEMSRKIDFLILAGLKGNADLLAQARKRLNELRKTKDLFYDECRARRDMGEAAEAFAKAWGAFGNDNEDLRSRWLANPKEWRRE